MIKTVFLFPNGNVACTDESGNQVPHWQASLLVDHLRRMQDAGVIDSTTQVATANGSYPLDQFLPLGRTLTTIDIRAKVGDVRLSCPVCHWRVTLSPEALRVWLGDPPWTPRCQRDDVALVQEPL